MPNATHPSPLATTLAAYAPPPEPISPLMRLFWWCAGANQHLLEKCPTDHIKYGNIGATVVMTACMAGISMIYALHAVFEATWAAVLMGLIWAGVIFLIDRSIVASMRKPSREAAFWSWATWGEVPFVVVRFGVAIIIALTISKPLEVKIFERRIAAQIDKDKLAEEKQAKEDIAKINGIGERKEELQTANEEIKQLGAALTSEPPYSTYQELKQQRIGQVNAYNKVQNTNGRAVAINKAKISAIKNKQTQAVQDENGNTLRYELTQAGRNAIGSLTAINNKLLSEISSKRALVDKTDRKLADMQEDYQKELMQRQGQAQRVKAHGIKALLAADSAARVRQQAGELIRKRSYDTLATGTYPLMTQVSALGTLTRKDKSLDVASLLITLLFLAIETAPLLVKLFSKRGPYDDELELAEHMAWVRMQYEKSQVNSKINRKLEAINQADERIRQTIEARQQTLFETSTRHLEKQQELELANNEQLLQLIAEKQLHLANELVKDWYEKELAKLPAATASTGVTAPVPALTATDATSTT